MLSDVKSSVALLTGHQPASRSGASLVGSTVFNMGSYLGGSFILNVGAITGGGLLAAKLQYSSTSDFSSDVNDDDGSTGNTAPVTGINTANSAKYFHIKLPKDAAKPYYRLAVTDSVAAVVYASSFAGKAKVAPVVYP